MTDEEFQKREDLAMVRLCAKSIHMMGWNDTYFSLDGPYNPLRHKDQAFDLIDYHACSVLPKQGADGKYVVYCGAYVGVSEHSLMRAVVKCIANKMLGPWAVPSTAQINA